MATGGASGTPPLFGDLLALARQSWVRQMAAGLATRGYSDYRRTDAAVMRALLRHDGPLPVGRIGQGWGTSRQAARKIVAGLEERGLAVLAPDPEDGRRRNVVLTGAGRAYASAVSDVVEELNTALDNRISAPDMERARRVLWAVLDAEPAPGEPAPGDTGW